MSFNKQPIKWKRKKKYSALTLLKARLRQFLTADRSPFFQMLLPKHSQASARDGFSLTWCMKIEVQSKIIPLNINCKIDTLSSWKLTTWLCLQLLTNDLLLLYYSQEIHSISSLSNTQMLHVAWVTSFLLAKKTIYEFKLLRCWNPNQILWNKVAISLPTEENGQLDARRRSIHSKKGNENSKQEQVIPLVFDRSETLH